MLVTTGSTSKDAHGGQRIVVDKTVEDLSKTLDETITMYREAKGKCVKNEHDK